MTHEELFQYYALTLGIVLFISFVLIGLIRLGLAAWVISDARRRTMDVLAWGLITFWVGAIVLPVYLALRPRAAHRASDNDVAWRLLTHLSWVYVVFHILPGLPGALIIRNVAPEPGLPVTPLVVSDVLRTFLWVLLPVGPPMWSYIGRAVLWTDMPAPALWALLLGLAGIPAAWALAAGLCLRRWLLPAVLAAPAAQVIGALVIWYVPLLVLVAVVMSILALRAA